MARFKETPAYKAMSKADKLRLRGQGNANASKNALSTYIRRRLLIRPEDAVAARIGQQLQDALVEMKGGDDNVTAAERAVIEGVGISRVVALLCLREISEQGGFKDGADGRVASPAIKLLASYLGLERQGLQTLGLERRGRSVMNLDDYLRTVDAKAVEVKAIEGPKEQ